MTLRCRPFTAARYHTEFLPDIFFFYRIFYGISLEYILAQVVSTFLPMGPRPGKYTYLPTYLPTLDFIRYT
jgi:hypothetical protein